MDPLTTLAEMRELAAEIQRREDAAGEYGMTDHARNANLDDGTRLAELFAALDEWRVKGGFDPWQVERVRVMRAKREAAQAEAAMRIEQGRQRTL
jgi:hypothetical protein